MAVPSGLRRTRRPVRKGNASFVHVGSAGILKALPPVRATSYNAGVVLVLTVVFPTALVADLVAAALRQRGVPTAGARVWPTIRMGNDVLLRRVHLEPTPSLSKQFFVRQRRIVVRSPHDSWLLTLRLLRLPTEPGHSDIVPAPRSPFISRQSGSFGRPLPTRSGCGGLTSDRLTPRLWPWVVSR